MKVRKYFKIDWKPLSEDQGLPVLLVQPICMEVVFSDEFKIWFLAKELKLARGAKAAHFNDTTFTL